MAISNTQKRWAYIHSDTSSLAFTSNVTAGALLIFVSHCYSGWTDGSSVSDDNGNTWNRLRIGHNGVLYLDIWYAFNANAGATTVSWTSPDSSYVSFAIYEYAGATTTDPIDQNPVVNTGASANPASTAITTTQAAEMIFAAATDTYGGSETIDGDADYTLLQEAEGGATYMRFNDQERIVSGTLTDTANWTFGTSHTWAAGIASFKAGAGSTYTLTATQQSYTLSGQAANLLRGRVLSAAQQSYALAGQTVNLLYGRKFAAVQKSYTLTGQAAILANGRKIAASQVAFSMAGQAVLFSRTQIMPAAQSSYTLTLQASNLLRGRKLAAIQVAFTLTGEAAGWARTHVMGAVQQSFTLTGEAVNFLFGRLLGATQQGYILTGEIANALLGRVLAAAQQSYALAGIAVKLTKTGAYTLTATQQVYTLSGQAAGVLFGRKFAATQQSYVLTGEAANVLFGRKFAAVQASYTLTGEAANVLFGRKFATVQASFTLTGIEVTLTKSGVKILAAGLGTFTLGGQASGLLWKHLIGANQQNYTLAGETSNLLYGRTMAAVQQSYSLLGQVALWKRFYNLAAISQSYAMIGIVVRLAIGTGLGGWHDTPLWKGIELGVTKGMVKDA